MAPRWRVIVALFAATAACGAPPSQPLNPSQTAITVEHVSADIVGKGPNEGLMGWRFDPGESRDVKLLTVDYESDTAVATVDIKTERLGTPGGTGFSATWNMAGKVGVHYKWDQEKKDWILTRLDNISFAKQ